MFTTRLVFTTRLHTLDEDTRLVFTTCVLTRPHTLDEDTRLVFTTCVLTRLHTLDEDTRPDRLDETQYEDTRHIAA